MFIATANALDLIPGPLLDRLEVITLLGYTEEEKVKIATRYLIPREVEETGLSDTPPVLLQRQSTKSSENIPGKQD